MNRFPILSQQIFTQGKYSIVPIRMEDRYEIMRWRNEQIYHLRQSKPLTPEDQDAYFENVVAKLFEQEQPDQLLFSYLEGDCCIGYGGLVHINWTDLNAEISFIMDTVLEENGFEFHWKTYLGLIEQVAYQQLRLHKIFTYAFDLRPNLYNALENAGYEREAILKEHCFYNNSFIDVHIHTKINDGIQFRPASIQDCHQTFEWVNDGVIRKYSLNKKPVVWKNHEEWFRTKIGDTSSCLYLMATKGENLIGSVRFDIENNELATISYLLDPLSHGKGLGYFLVRGAMAELKKRRPKVRIVKALVLRENYASHKIFKRIEYDLMEQDEKKSIYQKVLL